MDVLKRIELSAGLARMSQGARKEGALREMKIAILDFLREERAAQHRVQTTDCYACADTGIIRCDGVAVNCPVCNPITSG